MKKFTQYLYIFFSFSTVWSQTLYFSNSHEVIRMDIEKFTIDTIWSSPFKIFDESISPSGQQIGFTKYENGNRLVGIYNIQNKVYRILDTISKNNYNLVIAPSGNSAAFNSWIGSKWVLSIYDLKSDIESHEIFIPKDNAFDPIGWENDSILQIITFNGLEFVNIKKNVTIQL